MLCYTYKKTWEELLRIRNIEKIDMSCFKHLYAGGEKMDLSMEEKINQLIQKCGSNTKLYNCMGATEMMAGATIIYDNCYVPGSVGIPMVRVGCKIVEPESEKELTYYEEGEICFSGATVMDGYYNNPEATDAVIKKHRDGERWFHTGDLGYINEDGVIFVTGRIKRIIMTKGNDGLATKLFPDRIEKAIYANPAVDLCCVVGIPHETRINYPKAFVVLKEGIPQSNDVKQSILSGCKELLPDYMIPEEIEFRSDLPRTSRGKVDYRALEAH
jgi:long-chain acyl-CoA synthetase